MPTINWKVQQDGSWRGWSALFGADFGYQAVDDSDGITHDEDATHLTLPRLNLPAALGRVSFPFVLGVEGMLPTSIVVNVAAIQGGAAHPRMEIGFFRHPSLGFHITKFDPGASYSVASRTFTTDPITGLAWTLLTPDLEVCIQNEDGVAGNNDLSLVSGSITFNYPTNYDPILPRSAGWM